MNMSLYATFTAMKLTNVGGKRSWWRCIKCGKWKVNEHLQKVEVVSEYIDNGMMCSNDTCEYDVNSVQINLSEIEPGTELKREDRVSIDHEGNVTVYAHQDTREQLEADIRAWHRDTPFATKPSVQTLLGWLDRQAAITEREQTDKWQHLAYGNELLEADKMALQDSVTELTTERDRLKKRLEHQATYIAGVEDELCRYELQLVRNEKDFDKLTAERDHLQAAVDALEDDCEKVDNLTVVDDRLTAVQARETAMNSDDKWIQNCADEVVRNILYVIWQESRKGFFSYQVDFKMQPFEVREAILIELSELGYNYKQQHWWNKDKYVISW